MTSAIELSLAPHGMPEPAPTRREPRDPHGPLMRVADAMRAIGRASPAPWIVTDARGSIVALHPGEAPGAWPAVGTSLLDAVPAEHRALLDLAFADACAGRLAASTDAPLASRDGRLLWFQTSMGPIHSETGEVVGVLWHLSDVTARREEEARLRRSESMMTDTHGVAHLGTWDWDPKEPHATWSPELYRMYGLDPSHTPTYEDYLTRVHPDDRQKVIDATNGVFNDHRPYSHDERIFRPDGSIRWLHTWAQAVTADDGTLLRLLGVCQDITERKLAELEVAERLREKEVMLREIHHRVKNNLQVVASLLNMQSHATASDEVKTSLEEARDRVRSMAMVHETLYRSGVLSKIDLREYLRTLAREAVHAQSTRRGAIRLNVEGDPVEMEMEAAINVGLLVNELISNALKHAFPDEREGSVDVEVRSRDTGHIDIIVRDDGIGISATPTTSTGIGLRLVDALVRQLRGTLERTSDGGTKFHLTIPPHGGPGA